VGGYSFLMKDCTDCTSQFSAYSLKLTFGRSQAQLITCSPAVLTFFFLWFSSLLPTSVGMVHLIKSHHCLPHPSQFTTH